jgi:uncharacterized membrane protein HdeD (DUF308 family)
MHRREGDTTMSIVQILQSEIPQEMIRNWGWYLAFGIGLSLLGITAIVRSVAATVVTMLFFGWLLVISAAIEIAQALMVGAWAGFLLHSLSAVLFGVIGLLLIRSPVLGAEVATLLMAAFFLIGGLFRLIGAMTISLSSWNWQVALDGAVGLVLGVLILARWPASGLSVIGFFVGLDLLLYGAVWVSLALSLRAM